MTEAPVGVSSGHRARGCPGPISPKLNGQQDHKPTSPAPPCSKQTDLGSTSLISSGPGSMGPGATCAGSTGPCGSEEDNYAVCRRKCGCMRTSDKLKQILLTFPNPQPPEAVQTYMSDKASGYSYGQTEKHSCRTCNKPKEAERSTSAILPVKDKMDPCLHCILHRRKLRQAAEEEEPNQDPCLRCILHRRKLRQAAEEEEPNQDPCLRCILHRRKLRQAAEEEEPNQDPCLRCILHRRKLRQAAEEEEPNQNEKATGYRCGQTEKHACCTCNKPKEAERSASVIVPVKDKMNEKATGYGYGQTDKHAWRTCNKLKEAERSASAIIPVTDKMNEKATGYSCRQNEKLAGRICSKLKEAERSASAIMPVKDKMTEKATGYGGGQTEKHAGRTYNKPKETERSASAIVSVKDKMNEKATGFGQEQPKQAERSASAIVPVKDKMNEKATGFGHEQPKEAERSASAIVPVKDKMNEKATGYGYGQTEKHAWRTYNKPKETERSASAIVSVKDKMDPCLGCILRRHKLRQSAKEEELMQPYHAKSTSRSWQIVSELVSLVQLSVTATALALYYLIYCYMQLVYYTLRSALYFHNADGPMKITIGVVTLTSLIVGFNILMRMEGIIGIVY